MVSWNGIIFSGALIKACFYTRLCKGYKIIYNISQTPCVRVLFDPQKTVSLDSSSCLGSQNPRIIAYVPREKLKEDNGLTLTDLSRVAVGISTLVLTLIVGLIQTSRSIKSVTRYIYTVLMAGSLLAILAIIFIFKSLRLDGCSSMMWQNSQSHPLLHFMSKE